MKYTKINILAILLLVSVILTGCFTTGTDKAKNQNVGGMSEAQILALLQSNRAKDAAGSEEADKGTRALSSYYKVTVNPNTGERAFTEVEHGVSISSNAAYAQVSAVDIAVNQPANLGLRDGEIVQVPVGSHIKLGDAAGGNFDSVEGQIRALSELSRARGDVFKGVIEIDGKNRQLIIETVGNNRVNLVTNTLAGLTSLAGEVVDASPVKVIGETAMQTVKVLGDNGEITDHVLVQPLPPE